MITKFNMLYEYSVFDSKTSTYINIFLALNQSNKKNIKKYIELGGDLNTQNAFGETPLIYAALIHNLSIIEMFIDAGADWNITDESGQDFFDFLNYKERIFIKEEYPEKYKKYLRYKNTNKFNI